jgi:hypothetical protein
MNLESFYIILADLWYFFSTVCNFSLFNDTINLTESLSTADDFSIENINTT